MILMNWTLKLSLSMRAATLAMIMLPFNVAAISIARLVSCLGCDMGSALPNTSVLKKYQYASCDRGFRVRACVVPSFAILSERLTWATSVLLPTLKGPTIGSTAGSSAPECCAYNRKSMTSCTSIWRPNMQVPSRRYML